MIIADIVSLINRRADKLLGKYKNDLLYSKRNMNATQTHTRLLFRLGSTHTLYNVLHNEQCCTYSHKVISGVLASICRNRGPRYRRPDKRNPVGSRPHRGGKQFVKQSSCVNVLLFVTYGLFITSFSIKSELFITHHTASLNFVTCSTFRHVLASCHNSDNLK